MAPVVLTCSEGSFPGLAGALRERAVPVLERPLLHFFPPQDWAPLDEALRNVHGYRAVAFTSPRAASAVVDRLGELGIHWPEKSRPEIWAVGRATADPLSNRLGVVRIPDPQTAGLGAAEQLAHAMLRAGVESPVLFPAGERRREELPQLLRRNGIRVDEVVCYRTVLADRAAARSAAAEGLVIVASPSVVELLLAAIDSTMRPELVAVGPTTAQAARDARWEPAAVAAEPTTEGIVAAVTSFLARR